MAKAPGLLNTYMHGYEQFRENSSLEPAEQEVVFLTISRENGCGYCMGAHSMLADKVSDVPADTLKALREGGDIPDERLAALSRFTRVMFQSRGRPGKDDAKAFMDAGFEETDIMDIILALAVKTLSNYSNHINQPELDQAFSGHKWEN
jgi:AhpD family alkylhydroperoxidase